MWCAGVVEIAWQAEGIYVLTRRELV